MRGLLAGTLATGRILCARHKIKDTLKALVEAQQTVTGAPDMRSIGIGGAAWPGGGRHTGGRQSGDSCAERVRLSAPAAPPQAPGELQCKCSSAKA